VIRCIDQRSAHQNGIIALKKWETWIRDFLAKPQRKMDEENRTNERKVPIEKGGHPTSPLQIQRMISSASRVRKTLPWRRVVIR
jgi:hypothetical protein